MRRLVPALLLALPLLAQAPGGHGGPTAVEACLACHPQDGVHRWEAYREAPCAPFCLGCHPATEMAQHHPIGGPLARSPGAALRLTSEGRMTCATCHRLSTPRRDRVRWRAESLYGRLFRRQDTYLTYYLVFRNDRGQLCRACH